MTDQMGEPTERVAGIDCGTNSIRLLVADLISPGGQPQLRELCRTMRIVRLGEGIDRTKHLDSAALERTFSAVEEFAQICRGFAVKKIRFVATSATRDADNKEIFTAGIQQRLGIIPEVVSGEQEAELSFKGAVSGEIAQAPKPLLVVDIGGGSTEFILGEATAQSAISVDMGCVRITERFLNQNNEAAARDYLNKLLDQVAQAVPLGETRSLVGLAGSVTTITACALGLSTYDPQRIDGAQLGVSKVLAACQRLQNATALEHSQMGFLHPGRADVIAGGALVWSLVIQRVVREVESSGRSLKTIFCSERDILDGITLSLA